MTAPTGKTVIGCVHGAWWQLRDAMGDDAPTYDWCEQQWTSGLSKQVTVGAKDLPQRLTALMRARWATERTNEPALGRALLPLLDVWPLVRSRLHGPGDRGDVGRPRARREAARAVHGGRRVTAPFVPLVCVYDKHPHDGICVWWAGSEHGISLVTAYQRRSNGCTLGAENEVVRACVNTPDPANPERTGVDK